MILLNISIKRSVEKKNCRERCFYSGPASLFVSQISIMMDTFDDTRRICLHQLLLPTISNGTQTAISMSDDSETQDPMIMQAI